MSDQLMHYGVKGMRRGTRKSREERNAERRAKYEAKLKAKYGDNDIGKIETYLKIRKEHADKVKKWRQANQRNRQLTATERREKYYGELDRGKLGKTYSTDATLAEAARRYYKKGHNKRMGHSELMHYGVKGMKWGVRKQRPSGGAGPSKKRKGLSRKQKAAIAGVLGTAAAAGAGYYLHKSGNGKKLAGLAKKQGAAAKKFAQGKGRNLGAQARVKTAQSKRFAKAQSANVKGAADKLKQTKVGKYAEATRLGANAAKFKAGTAARSAGYKAKNQAWKAGNTARNAAKGGASGVKSAAGSAARAAKSKFGKKAPSKALSTAVRSGGAGRRKLAVSGTKVVGRGDKTLAKNLAKIGAVGVGAHATGVVAGRAAAKAAGKKLESTGKRRRPKKRR